jgi:DNA integrity scanning protein DisA with diadenylate cyclase activity
MYYAESQSGSTKVARTHAQLRRAARAATRSSGSRRRSLERLAAEGRAFNGGAA